MEMPTECYHNEKVEIKSDNFKVAQKISNTGFVAFLIHEIAFPVIDFSLHFQNSQSKFLTHLDKAHPPDSPDIVILIHSFLIWNYKGDLFSGDFQSPEWVVYPFCVKQNISIRHGLKCKGMKY